MTDDNRNAALVMAIRQALLAIVDAVERWLAVEGAFRGTRTAELRRELKATREEYRDGQIQRGLATDRT